MSGTLPSLVRHLFFVAASDYPSIPTPPEAQQLPCASNNFILLADFPCESVVVADLIFFQDQPLVDLQHAVRASAGECFVVGRDHQRAPFGD